jgi:hypothetical protein
MMVAVGVVLCHVAKDDGLAVASNFVAQRGSKHQFAANAQAERDFIADGAGHPAVLGDTSDRGEAHAGGPARDLENFRNYVQAADRGHIVGDRCGHLNPDSYGPRPTAPVGCAITILPQTISCRRRGARLRRFNQSWPEKRAAHQRRPESLEGKYRNA